VCEPTDQVICISASTGTPFPASNGFSDSRALVHLNVNGTPLFKR
jgi:hypothetical protein